MKKNEELLHSIGEIDNRYIENAKPQKTKKKKIIWIGSVSAAACIIALLGWQYCFVLKPLRNIESKNTTVTEQTITQETELSETTQTDNDIEADQEKEYPEIKTLDMNTTSEDIIKEIKGIGFDGENIIVQELAENETDYNNRYVYLNIKSGSESQTISLPEITFATSDSFYSSCDVCCNDDYLFLLINCRLWSVSMQDHNIIANIGGFHGPMDISGHSECLGVDTSGNVYILTNTNYSSVEDPGYHLIKYSPELELISEYVTQNEIPFTHIINFDDMYIDENSILYCTYNDNETVTVDINDGSILSDNILIDGDYWCAKDENDNTPLKMYCPDNSKRYSGAKKNCIDSVVTLSGNWGDYLSFSRMNINGEFIDRYPFSSDIIASTGFDFSPDGSIVLPIQKADPLGNFELLSFNLDDTTFTGYTTSALDCDISKQMNSINLVYCNMVDFIADKSFYFIDQNVSVNTINNDLEHNNKVYKYTPDSDNQTFVDVGDYFYSVEKKIVLINNKPCINFRRSSNNSYCCDLDFENGTYSEPYEVPGLLYPQRDGTVLYIADSALYSYPDNTKIFDLPENMLPSSNQYDIASYKPEVFIEKIDDSRYVYVNNASIPNIHFLTKK